MPYQHTQTGRLHHLLYIVVGILLVGAWFTQNVPGMIGMAVILVIAAAVILALSFAMTTLSVQDEGDRLAIRFGPVPLFSKTISYAEITAVEPDRTKLIDGWGIHYIPGRGTTWNVWGFDCVKLTLGRKVVRVGTDDVEKLVAFLHAKISP